MSELAQARRVLVADDDEDVCFFLRRYLEQRGFKVVSLLDGQDVKEAIEREHFDYFLLDCSMQNVTGLELIERARQRNPKAKIVLISGFPTADNAMIKELGGDQFIHKPIRLEEIDAIFK